MESTALAFWPFVGRGLTLLMGLSSFLFAGGLLAPSILLRRAALTAPAFFVSLAVGCCFGAGLLASWDEDESLSLEDEEPEPDPLVEELELELPDEEPLEDSEVLRLWTYKRRFVYIPRTKNGRSTHPLFRCHFQTLNTASDARNVYYCT